MSHTVQTWPVNLIFMGDDHWSDLDTATWSLKKIIIFLTSWLGGSNVSIQFNSKNFSNSEGKCSSISRLYLIFCGSETRNTSHFFSFLKKNPTNLCLIFNLTLNTKHCQKSMLLSKCVLISHEVRPTEGSITSLSFYLTIIIHEYCNKLCSTEKYQEV